MPTIDVTKCDQFEVVAPAYRHYMEFGEERYPGLMHPAVIKFTVSNPEEVMKVWQLGKEINVKLPGHLESKGLVTEIEMPIDGMAQVTVRLTGAPRRLSHYGKSFTESIIEKIAEATKIEAHELLRDAKNRVPIYTGSLAQQAMERSFIHGHPNCRCTPVGITRRRAPVKIRNRFYVAAPSVTTEREQAQDNTEKNVHLAVSSGDRSGKWTRKDLKAAIAHAEQILELEPSKDHVAVVQIVRVVRRKKAPVVVEVVK